MMKDDSLSTEYGEIPADWQIKQLRDVCVPNSGVQTGPFGSQLHQRDYQVSGTPIITVEHLGENRIIHHDLPLVSDADRQRLARYDMRQGDIIFSRVGSVDRRSLVREEEDGWLFSGRCLRVRPNSEVVSPEYLSWFFGLPAFKEHIRAIAVGATMPSINTDILSGVQVILPPLPEQRAIAHILGALDDKIELNRRMNQTLESMAQALFKSWFVDFDPVTKNAERGMQNDELFPAEFVASELGAIPKGWKVIPAGEMVTAVGGTTPSTGNPAFWEGGTIFWATPKDLSKLTDPVLLETERKITPAGLKQISSGLLPAGTLLMSSRAPVGYLAISEIPVAINQGFIAMLCDKGVPAEYVLQWLNENMETIVSHANGTTFMEISKTSFRAIPALVPPEPLLLRFSEIAGKYHRMVAENLRQSRTLASIRDALLPRLLSGEVRVR